MLNFFAEAGPHISVASEVLFHIGPIPVNNSMMLGLIGYILVLTIFLSTVWQMKKGSRSLFMHAVMWVFEILYSSVEQVVGDRERARRVAPLAITLLVTILLNNWLGLLPIVGPITYNGTPLFRGLAADLNFTLALGLITMVSVQVWAIKTHGFFKNIGRYLRNPFKDPLGAFEGILELITELSRLVALSMRLFGNVLGGEILLIVISFVASYGAPLALPVFMILELFVGAIQAYVFFMLAIVYISLGSVSHDEYTSEPIPHPIETNTAIHPGGINSR